jgi:uncharacterized protein
MAESKLGTVAWVDLTVADADCARDFYRAVVGWEPSPVKMGDYDDFNMRTPGAQKPAAGICHARGENAKLPAQWMIYVPVKDLAASIAACEKFGGTLLARLSATLCVIQDPAGAVMAIMQDEK